MPVLIYEGSELNQNQREELIKSLTDAACKVIPNIPKEAYYIFLREYPGEKVGVGGLTLPDYLANSQKKKTES
jgi:4-oxalocrotonate tautomerase